MAVEEKRLEEPIREDENSQDTNPEPVDLEAAEADDSVDSEAAET